MSDQETVGTGVEASPTRDDLGQLTEEALVERLMDVAEPLPVEEPETPAEPVAAVEEEYEEEVSEDPQAADSDDYEEGEAEEAIDESYDNDSDEEPQLFSVKVDGEEEQVPLEELLRGYSGQQYIQRQMQKVADSRKETEAIYAALAQERSQVQQALQLLQDGTLSTPPVPPNEDLFNSDPLAYMEAKLNYDKQANEYNQRLDVLRQQVEAQTENQQQARQVYLAREAEMLQGFAPELFDEEKGSENRQNLINSAAEAYGFTPEELGAVLDHRHVRVLLDAVKYQQLNSETGKKRVEQKVQQKTVRSSKRKVNAEQAAQRKKRQKLKESGSIEDALDLIMQ
jgi:hypothetical protein